LNLPFPFPDALQEFKVETSAQGAQNGSHAGATVNALVKSGTNSWHGDLFEFVRNYKFNARNIFATRRESLKRNQFGGVIISGVGYGMFGASTGPSRQGLKMEKVAVDQSCQRSFDDGIS
jgi:hypothetical protein